MKSEIRIQIEKNDSVYSAYFPEIEGYRVEGDSLDVVVNEIKEAIIAYLKREEKKTDNKVAKPIWEIAQEITQNLTEDELNQLPIDGAHQHDHYIYGTPKIET